tara:strand:- start:318 stop:698 length:381 start_codon:yes stop_codon:yes gene_type:complete
MQVLKKKDNTSFFLQSRNTKVFEKNTKIYDINEAIEYLYVILDGKVESYNYNKNNKVILEKGSILGLMDLILNRNYSKFVIAKTKVVLALIKKSTLDSLLEANNFQGILIKSLALDIDANNPKKWS